MSAGKLGVANTAQGGFINIGADTRQVQKRFEGLMRAVKDEQKQLAIHRKVAKVVKVTMRAEVYDENADAYEELLGAVSDLLTDETLIALNAEVDVEGRQPAEVATEFLEDNGIV